MGAGRPLKFKTVKELQDAVDAYFDSEPEETWTITGLALALDTYRSVLIDYGTRDEYSYTIKKAKEMVHNSYEKDLRKKGRSGDIFALKNFGWSDRQEVDHTTGGEKMNLTVQFIANEHPVPKEITEDLPAEEI